MRSKVRFHNQAAAKKCTKIEYDVFYWTKLQFLFCQRAFRCRCNKQFLKFSEIVDITEEESNGIAITDFFILFHFFIFQFNCMLKIIWSIRRLFYFSSLVSLLKKNEERKNMIANIIFTSYGNHEWVQKSQNAEQRHCTKNVSWDIVPKRAKYKKLNNERKIFRFKFSHINRNVNKKRHDSTCSILLYALYVYSNSTVELLMATKSAIKISKQ